MFRKLLLASAASLALLSPLAVVKSEAHDERSYHHHHRFVVYFRASGDDPWRFGGEFRFRHEAERRADHLRDRGFETFVR